MYLYLCTYYLLEKYENKSQEKSIPQVIKASLVIRIFKILLSLQTPFKIKYKNTTH
jgi:hypothetical protein